MNALVITSHSFAMLFEHGKLLFHGGRIITHVAGIAVLRHQFQRDFLAAAANQQRDMWLLDALGLVNSATHLIILAFKGGLFLLVNDVRSEQVLPSDVSTCPPI